MAQQLYGFWVMTPFTQMQDLADDRQLPIHTMPKVLNGHIDRFIVVVYGSFWLIIGLYAYTITLRWPFLSAGLSLVTYSENSLAS